MCVSKLTLLKFQPVVPTPVFITELRDQLSVKPVKKSTTCTSEAGESIEDIGFTTHLDPQNQWPIYNPFDENQQYNSPISGAMPTDSSAMDCLFWNDVGQASDILNLESHKTSNFLKQHLTDLSSNLNRTDYSSYNIGDGLRQYLSFGISLIFISKMSSSTLSRLLSYQLRLIDLGCRLECIALVIFHTTTMCCKL